MFLRKFPKKCTQAPAAAYRGRPNFGSFFRRISRKSISIWMRINLKKRRPYYVCLRIHPPLPSPEYDVWNKCFFIIFCQTLSDPPLYNPESTVWGQCFLIIISLSQLSLSSPECSVWGQYFPIMISLSHPPLSSPESAVWNQYFLMIFCQNLSHPPFSRFYSDVWGQYFLDVIIYLSQPPVSSSE